MQTPHAIAQEAARIVCEDLVIDYAAAKKKALARLGLSPRAALPENAQVQQAVIEYQQLFGGARYRELLARMRSAALQAMTLLRDFSPCLAGALVSGAVTRAHRVQLHAFSERAEAVEIFLGNRGHAVEQGERVYRYPGGREQQVAVVGFELADAGIDVAVFDQEAAHQVPLNPLDGKSFQRLDSAAVRALG
ncbi:MAG TPA: hypothetical protein VHE37_01950 [Nevskiaceae bacterium]|nr:hypothetical protein [Nevskiaceae bacterium]